MKNVHFEHPIFNHMEQPLQKLIELNVKTIQKMSYIKPDDLLNIKKPGDFLEKNMNVFIQNSHMVLNYMQDTFNILESHWSQVALNTEESAKKIAKQTVSSVKKTIKKSASSMKSVAQKTASHAKGAVKPSAKVKPEAQVAMKKNTSTANKAVAPHVSAKEMGNNMPKVEGMNEKSGIKNIGISIPKGSNLPN